jgi:uncharacterized protein
VRIVDANVLLYAINRSAPQHRPARSWLDRSLTGAEPIGLAWIVLLAFVRLSTHRAVFPRPLEIADAMDVVRGWLAQPAALVIEPTARHVDVLASLLAETGAGGNLVNDAHLAALAVEHDAVLISFDSDFGRFRGVRWSLPTSEG